MIYMDQPSLVLHSHNVPGYKYQMWATWTVPATLTADVLVGWIERAIDVAPELMLRNVILNCHGEPGYLYMGTGIGSPDLGPFERLRQKQAIGRIWIIACRVHDTTDDLGFDFCTGLAKAAAVSVLAADTFQYVNEKTLPYGFIDDFEGNTYAYDGAGNRELA